MDTFTFGVAVLLYLVTAKSGPVTEIPRPQFLYHWISVSFKQKKLSACSTCLLKFIYIGQHYIWKEAVEMMDKENSLDLANFPHFYDYKSAA